MAIVGNVISGIFNYAGYAISVANAENAVILGNTIGDSPNLPTAIQIRHSRGCKVYSNTAIFAFNNDALGINLYRSRAASVIGNLISFSGARTAGIALSDDANFPSDYTIIDGNLLLSATVGIQLLEYNRYPGTGARVGLGTNFAPDASTPIASMDPSKALPPI